MKHQALLAVLDALSGKCHEDMADSLSRPKEKMSDAIKMAKTDEDEDYEDEDAALDSEGEGKLAGMDDEEEEDEDPKDLKSAFRDFLNPKSKDPEPGTAYRIVVDDHMPMKKKMMRG